MKKILFTLITELMAALAAQAEITINSTYFPDANFRAYLLSLYPSGTITTLEQNSLIDIDVQHKNISSLAGVGFFPNLKYLECSYNNLTSLNLSSNTKLINVYCRGNRLTSLNVSGLTELKRLCCDDNTNLTAITGMGTCTSLFLLNAEECGFTTLYTEELTSLQYLTVANCTSLETLSCTGYGNNQLLALDVSGCTALDWLNCYGNFNLPEITGLSDCDNLTYLKCSSCALTGTLDLMELTKIANVDCSSNQLTKVNCYGKYSMRTLICSNNQLTNIDHSSCRYMTSLDCRNNPATTINLNNCNALTTLDCSGNNFTTITLTTGLGNLTTLNCKDNLSLTSLNCSGNSLTTLNVTNNTALKTLNCSSNANLSSITGLDGLTNLTSFTCTSCAFTTLNLAQKKSLQNVYCGSNQLTSLGLNGCTALRAVYCQSNQLATLNFQNFANLTTVNASDNPLLYSANFTGNSSMTSLNVSNCTALKSLYCYNNALTTLNISGIGTELTTLYCYGNQLTSLDVSNKTNLTTLKCENNPALTTLNCSNCKLSALNLTNNTALTSLNCGKNANLETVQSLAACTNLTYLNVQECAFTSLDVSALTKLSNLYFNGNPITSVSGLTGKSTLRTINAQNTSLSTFYAYNCPLLSSVDLSNCTNLQNAQILRCAVSSLDVSNCSKMTLLNVCFNNLQTLTVPGCTKLTSCYIYCNRIKDAKMTNLISSLPTVTSGTMRAIYNEGEQNVITTAQVRAANLKGWNVQRYNGSTWVNIDASYTRGDVDGDGEVAISDVSALIDYLLTGNGSNINIQAADCDEDGEVAIGDVSILIDYLLVGSW